MGTHGSRLKAAVAVVIKRMMDCPVAVEEVPEGERVLVARHWMLTTEMLVEVPHM